MREILSVLLCVLLLGSTLVVSADNGATVSVNNVSCGAGETVELTVSLENCTGFANLELEVGYDASVMTLTNAASANVGATFTKAQNIDKNPYNMSWTSMENIYYNGVVATLTFSVAENVVSGTYPVTVSYYKGVNGNYTDGYDVNIDENFESLNLSYVSGRVTVDGADPIVDVTGITLDKATLEMEVGESIALTATVEPENATDKSVVWISDNEAVATVEDGVVTAVNAGEAVITVTAGDKSATCVVTVNEPVVEVTGVTLDKATLEMEVGESVTLTATVEPENATDKSVVWISDNEAVATVEDGVVTAVSAGEAVITVTAGDKSASCTVTVNEPVIELPYEMDADSLNIDVTDMSITVSGKFVANADFVGDKPINGETVVVIISYLKDGVPYMVSATEATIANNEIIVPNQKISVAINGDYAVEGISVLHGTTAIEAVVNGELGAPVGLYK